jgi:hypothetical protein
MGFKKKLFNSFIQFPRKIIFRSNRARFFSIFKNRLVPRFKKLESGRYETTRSRVSKLSQPKYMSCSFYKTLCTYIRQIVTVIGLFDKNHYGYIFECLKVF